MAGSYSHVMHGGSSLLDDLGDAHEAIEELLFLVLTYASEGDIKWALSRFYEFQRGDYEPKTDSAVGRAYLRTKEIMAKGD